jgi:hypothetical protein
MRRVSLSTAPAPALPLAVALAVGVVTTPTSALAQAWLKDRRLTEGPGFRAGRFELHPGVAGEAGFDSNWLLRSSADGASNASPNAPVLPFAVFRITPHLFLSTLGADRKRSDTSSERPSLVFRFGGSATYRELIDLKSIDAARNMSLDADARLDILPSRPVSLLLSAGFTRSVQPSALGLPEQAFDTSYPRAGATLVLTPGEGTLSTSLGYSFGAMWFERNAAAAFTHLRHEVQHKTRWFFRPKTSLFHETDFGIVTYVSPENAVNVLNNAQPLRSKLGLEGLVTTRVSVLLSAGYGASFVDREAQTARQFDSVIGKAQARFALGNLSAAEGETPASTSTLTVAYSRDFETSYLGNVVGKDSGSLDFSFFPAGGKLFTSFSAALTALRYPEVFTTQSSVAPFTLLRPEVSLYGEYRVSTSFALNATALYAQTLHAGSEVLLDYGGSKFALTYSRAQLFLGARWFL